MTNGIGAARINASSDASFNDIPLSRWDGLSFGIMKDIEVLRRLREAGAPLTLSFGVMIGKAAARKWKNEQ